MTGQWIQTLAALPPLAGLLLKLTAILALSWLAHSLLARRNPRWRVALWRGAAVGLALTPLLAALLPALEIATPPPAPALPTVAAEPPTNMIVLREAPAALMPALKASRAATVTIPARTPPRAKTKTWLNAAREHRALWMWLAWGMVAAALGLRRVRAARSLRRIVESTGAAPAHADEILRATAARLGCRGAVALRVSEAIASPFLCGVRRPLIILPRAMTAPGFTAELPAILAHELAHLRSRDVLWSGVLRGLQALLWFHPLAWRVGAAHAAACEAVCDAVAADAVGGALSYSGTLARVALELRAGPVAALGGIPMARVADIRKRIEFLRRKLYASPLARRRLALATLAGLALVAGIAGVKVVIAKPAQQTTRGTHPPSGMGESATPAADANAAQTSVGPLQGIVRDGTGKVVAGADVTVVRQIYAEPAMKFEGVEELVQTRSAADGTFAFKEFKTNTEKASLFIRATAPGLSYGYVSINRLGRGGRSEKPYFDFLRQQSFDQADIILLPEMTIKGTVRDEKGAPVYWAQVSVGHIAPNVLTDREGRFIIHKVPPLRFGNFRTSPRIDVAHPDYLDEQVIYLTEGQAVAVTLKKGTVVRGRLTETRSGRGLAQAGVQARVPNSRTSIYYHAVVDRDGNYTLRVPEGQLTLTPFTVYDSADGNDYPTESSRALELAPGEAPTGVDFKFARGAALAGRVVTDNPKFILEGFRVSMQRMDNGSPLLARNSAQFEIKADGTFTIKRLAPGNYQFAIRNMKDGQFVTSKTLNITTPIPAEPIKLELKIDKIAAPIVELRGTVVDGAGKPLANARITITGPGRRMSSPPIRDVYSSTDGAFSVRGLPADQSLTLRAWDMTQKLTAVLTLPAQADRGQPVKIVLKPGASFAGQVLDAQGRPLEGVRASINEVITEGMGSTHRPIVSATTGKDGRYLLEGYLPSALESDVQLEISENLIALPAAAQPKWHFKTPGSGYPITKAAPGSRQTGLDFRVEQDNTITAVKYKPEEDTYYINEKAKEKSALSTVLKGRVTDPLGHPIAGATVTAWGIKALDSHIMGDSTASRMVHSPATTDADGNFVLNAKEPVLALDLNVSARDFAPRKFMLVPAGEKENLIQLAPGRSVIARVVKDGRPLAGVDLGLVMTNRNANTFEGPFNATTDAQGVARFDHVPAGLDYTVFGKIKSLMPYGALPATKLHVEDLAEPKNLGDLAVAPAYKVSGQVVLSDGKPFPLDSAIYISGENAWDSLTIPLAPDGRFEAQGLAADVYAIRLRLKGYVIAHENKSFDYGAFPPRLAGKVAGDITGLRILMQPGADPDSSEKWDRRSPAGYVRPDQRPLAGIAPEQSSTLPGVPKGNAAPDATISTKSRTVALPVKDLTGQPVAGAEVVLIQGRFTQDGDQPVPRISGPVKTDTQGIATFRDIPQDTPYRLSAYARVPGKMFGVALDYFPPLPTLPNSKPKPFDVIMVPATTVTGRVAVPAGYNPAKVTLRVINIRVRDRKSSFGTSSWEGDHERLPWSNGKTTLDKNGRFTLADVPAEATIYLAADGPGLGEAQVMSGQPGTGSLDMAMAAEGVIEGTVKDGAGKPAAGLEVYAHPQSRGGALVDTSPFRATSDKAGHYRIAGLPAVYYDVSAGPGARGTKQIDFVVTPMLNVSVKAGQRVKNIDFWLETGTIVQGMVRDSATSAPLKGAHVTALRGGSNDNNTVLGSSGSDAGGRYRIRVPAGPVTLYIDAPPDGYTYPQNPQGERYSNYFNKDIMVPPGTAAMEGGDFTLVPVTAADTIKTTKARGRVLDMQGRPLDRVVIREDVKYPDGRQEMGGNLGQTGADGRYEIQVQAGAEYKIIAGGGLFGTGRSQAFTAKENEIHAVEDVKLMAADSSVAGQVVDRQGAPVMNAEIDIDSDHNFLPRAAITGADGKFLVDHVVKEPVSVNVLVSGEGPQPGARADTMPGSTGLVFVVAGLRGNDKLTQAQAADLAATLANAECNRYYKKQPFKPDSFPAALTAGRWQWGRLDPKGSGGFSAEVSFDARGQNRKVQIFMSNDSYW